VSIATLSGIDELLYRGHSVAKRSGADQNAWTGEASGFQRALDTVDPALSRAIDEDKDTTRF
jgi:hypothetical protein